MINIMLMVTATALFLLGCAHAADTPALVLQALDDDGLNIVNECPQATFGETGAAPDLWFDLKYEDRARRRCELAIHHWLERDKPFDISFDFKVVGDVDDKQWLSIFQIHSFPDAKESWRCPIMALEAIGANLRMFNRWDLQGISDTSVSTCAHAQSSISSNSLIYDTPFELERWYRFRLSGMMSLTANGFLRVELNGCQIGEYSGPNTFNDQRQPYFKLGIYKPTSWSINRDYRVEYRNISLKTGETP